MTRQEALHVLRGHAASLERSRLPQTAATIRQAADVLETALPELMGSAEACKALGVKSSNLRQQAGLPAPTQLRSGPVWSAHAIRAFAAKRARQEG